MTVQCNDTTGDYYTDVTLLHDDNADFNDVTLVSDDTTLGDPEAEAAEEPDRQAGKHRAQVWHSIKKASLAAIEVGQ